MTAPATLDPSKSVPAMSAAPHRGLLLALLVGCVVLVYANSLRAPFLFDDTGAIQSNPTIQRLWSWAVLNPPNDGSTTTGRPLVNVSFAFNYALSGDNVWSYHALNLALHVVAALTLFGLVRRTLLSFDPSPSTQNSAAPIAFATAALWALHPLQTETVVCIAQRTELLCGVLYLLTLYGFVRGVERSAASRGWLALSIVACLAGMAAKEVMVTAPLLVLLYDRTFVARSFAGALRGRPRYYAGLAGTWLFLAFLVARSGGGRGVAAGFGLGVTWWSYLLTQCEALIIYLKLTLWPRPLVLDYGTAVVSSLGDVLWQGLIVLALLAATIWALVRKPVLGFVGAWFFVILAPSSSFVPLVTQTIAEHRMYLPLAAAVTLIVVVLQRRFGSISTWLFTALAVVLGGVSFARNQLYRDPALIWTDNVTTHPDGARAHNNLAWTLQKQGKSELANAHFARAIELQPDYLLAHYSWGVALFEQKRPTDAIAQFEAAVRLAPNHADAQINLGNALMQVHRASDAIPHYETALRLRPAVDAHYNLGVALAEAGRGDESILHFRAALQQNPLMPEAYYQLALVAERAGRLAEAERDCNETLRLAPNHAGAHAKLGLLFARSERLPAAAEHLRTALQLAPADADAHVNLGNVLLLQGQPREAIAEYETALRLRPNDRRLLENLQLAREALR